MPAKLHSIAAACIKLYKNKEIEVNTGEQQTTLIMADFQYGQKDLIRGVLIDAIGYAIIIEVGQKKSQVLINCWSIISVAEVGVLKSAYIEEDFRENRRAF